MLVVLMSVYALPLIQVLAVATQPSRPTDEVVAFGAGCRQIVHVQVPADLELAVIAQAGDLGGLGLGLAECGKKRSKPGW